jgi:hypothetical protein
MICPYCQELCSTEGYSTISHWNHCYPCNKKYNVKTIFLNDRLYEIDIDDYILVWGTSTPPVFAIYHEGIRILTLNYHPTNIDL